MASYTNLEAFYAQNEARRRSGEADYGVWWMEPERPRMYWRVSYVAATGEVYALQFAGAGGQVEVLGVFPPDEGPNYYKGLDALLEGWADRCGQPGSLAWVKEKLAPYRNE